MEAKIILVYEDAREATAVSEAVSPDNVEVPKSLSVETARADSNVVTSIKYEGDNLMTLLSTIDDLLSCASVAEKAFTATKKLK
jgi:hypothetical protein